MLTLAVMLAASLLWARYEWRRVQAREAEVKTLKRQLDQLSGLTKDATCCEVCHQPSQWLVPVMLFEAIEWTCVPCSELFAVKEAA